MSADTYAECPYCKEKNKQELVELENNKIRIWEESCNPEEHENRLKELEAQIAEKEFLEHSIAEYGEVGIYKDEFQVSYWSRCETCDREFSYNKTIPIEEIVQEK